jgi:hypothetical protein
VHTWNKFFLMVKTLLMGFEREERTLSFTIHQPAMSVINSPHSYHAR